MPKFIVPGFTDLTVAVPQLAATVPEVRARQSVTLDLARADRAAATLDPAECVELELSGGVRVWVRSDDLLQDAGAAATRSGEAFILPRTLPLGAATPRP